MKSITIQNTSATQISFSDGEQIVLFDKNTANVSLEGSVIRLKIVEGTRERELTFNHSAVVSPALSSASALRNQILSWINTTTDPATSVKKIKGLISQEGENDPTIILQQNDTENQVLGYYDGVGVFRIRQLGTIDFVEFDQDKTSYNITPKYYEGMPDTALFSMFYKTGMIMVETFENGEYANGMLVKVPFEIEIYP